MRRKILHITHLDNLRGILNNGGLWSQNHRPLQLSVRSSAYQRLQRNRSNRPVTLGPGGVLHDYVPFYFGHRSPMLLAIKNGRVEGVAPDQRPIIYLISDTITVAERTDAWVFTDGHAIMNLSRFFDRLEDLEQVDWATVMARRWHDTEDDPDRKRRKQAEFLVHRFFPLDLLLGIAVYGDHMRQEVETVLREEGSEIEVKVARKLYD